MLVPECVFEEGHKLPGPVSCYEMNDILFTSAAAFKTLNTDLDEYTHPKSERQII